MYVWMHLSTIHGDMQGCFYAQYVNTSRGDGHGTCNKCARKHVGRALPREYWRQVRAAPAAYLHHSQQGLLIVIVHGHKLALLQGRCVGKIRVPVHLQGQLTTL